MATFTGALHRLLQGYWSLRENIVDTIAPPPAGKLAKDLAAMFAQNKAMYDLLWMLFDGSYWNQTTADKKAKYLLKIKFVQAVCLLYTSKWAGELPDTADPVPKPHFEPKKTSTGRVTKKAERLAPRRKRRSTRCGTRTAAAPCR